MPRNRRGGGYRRVERSRTRRRPAASQGPSPVAPARPPEGVLLTLTWGDLYGKFDIDRFLSIVDAAPYDWLVAGLSVLGTILANAGMPQSSQRGAIAELLQGRERRRALDYFDRGERQILAHPEAIALGMKLAALRSPPSDDFGDPSSLVRLLAGLNELTPPERPGAVSTLLHIHAAQQNLWAEDLVREFDLFHGYEAALADNVRYDFGDRFRILTGLDALDFSAYAFGIYAIFSQYKTGRNLEGVNYRALAESTGQRAPKPEEFQRFVSLVSRSREELRQAFSGPDAERLSLADSIAFRTAPLVRLEHGGVVPVWLEWIQEKIGSAPRYLIQNSIGTDAEMKRFRGALGEAFEDYFLELLARMFPAGAAAIVDARDGLPGCDAVVLVDDAAVFLEFTISEPSLEMLWSGDEDGLREFASKRLVAQGKLGQLGSTIKAYQAGELVVAAGRPLARRIFPVIVTLTPLPLLMGLDRVLRESIQKDSPAIANGDDNVRPVLFTCAKDWEILEPLIDTGRLALAGTLDDWLAHGLRSGLGDYLLRDRGFAGTRNPHLARRWDALAEVLAPRAIELYGIDANPGPDSAPPT